MDVDGAEPQFTRGRMLRQQMQQHAGIQSATQADKQGVSDRRGEHQDGHAIGQASN